MSEINVVIGSWGSYNECNKRSLGSTWLCLNDFISWEEIEQELVKQGFVLNGIDEELFVQDIEGIPSNATNWDYMSPERLFNVLYESGILENEYKYETMMAYLEIESFSEFEDLVERYGCRWDDDINLYKDYDWEDLGRYFLLEVGCYEVPEYLENHIDFKSYGEQYQFDGFHEYSEGIIEIRR